MRAGTLVAALDGAALVACVVAVLLVIGVPSLPGGTDGQPTVGERRGPAASPAAPNRGLALLPRATQTEHPPTAVPPLATARSAPQTTAVPPSPTRTPLSVTATPLAVIPSRAPTAAPPTGSPSGAEVVLLVGNTGGTGAGICKTPRQADRLGQWPDGTPVVALSTMPVDAEGHLWRIVRDPLGRVGWVVAEYLVPPRAGTIATTPVPGQGQDGGAQRVTIRAYAANVRAGPAQTFGIVGSAPKGTRLTLVDPTPGAEWVRVCCVAGRAGWILSELVVPDP